MKIFKNVFGLFLVSLVMLAIGLTSCQKEEVNPTMAESISNLSAFEASIPLDQTVSFYGPRQLDENSSVEEIQSYLESMSKEEITMRVESYKIESYLTKIEKLEYIKEDLGELDILTMEDVNPYLDETQKAELKSFSYEEATAAISARECRYISSRCVRWPWCLYQFRCYGRNKFVIQRC